MKEKKKIVSLLIITILLCSIWGTTSKANYNVTSAQLYSLGSFQYFTYKGQAISSTTVYYRNNEIEYPAYPLETEKSGVGNGFTYTVTAKELVTNQKINHIIMNGYPYQSIEDLGCKDQKEAYAATNEAIEFILYKKEADFENYESIGQAGERVLNAMKQIVENTRKGINTRVDANVNVQEVTEWVQDSLLPDNMSKVWKVNGQVPMGEYEIEVVQKEIEDVKITDEANQEKKKFSANENFKISIPIGKLQSDGNIEINIKTFAKSYPIFYGEPPSTTYNKAYALTAGPYQDIQIGQTIKYLQNETKIMLNQKDSQTGNSILGAQYELLNHKKEVILSDLTTNEIGQIKIEKLLPGTYYLKNIKMPEPYQIYTDLIEVELQLNEEKTINIQNTKKEPEPEKEEIKKDETKKQQTKTESNQERNSIVKIDTTETIKKLPGDFKALPKTGM